MQTIDKLSSDHGHQNVNDVLGSAEIVLKFQDGTVKTLKISGILYADLETGAMKIENDNGSKFVFIPNPEFHTGKRKRRLKVLHNL